MKLPKVLIVATSRKSRGGITSVIKAHKCGNQWKEYNCIWIETVRDSNSIIKILYFIRALLIYLFLLPFCKIVHIHSALGTSIKRKNFFISLAKIYRKRVILHFHAADPSILDSKNDNVLYRKIFNKADSILVLSNSWKQLLIDKLFLDSSKISILKNPAPHVKRNNNKKPIILFAGTLIKRKGYDILIRAFAKTQETDSFKDWKLILAGNGEKSEAKKLISEYNLEKKIILSGWVSGQVKESLFQCASIFCLPSQAEGFPMAILDAWAYGIPCIMTPVGGIPELVKDKEEGLIVPVNSIDKLSDALIKLMQSSELRTQIVENTDKRIATDFSIERINHKLSSIYNNILNNNILK